MRPNPGVEWPFGVNMKYMAVLLEAAVRLPKCTAARSASAAISVCEGRAGSGFVLSAQPDFTTWAGLVAKTAPGTVEQSEVPIGTDWQYCVVEFAHGLPPTPR